MVDLKFLDRINLASYPHFQAFVARTILTPNYKLFSKVEINIENVENIPKDETVIFAMNHTDRFNYWPFQYKLWKIGGFPYTTVWVKGKYYGNAVLKKVLELCNTFPVPSKGYLVEEFFKKIHNRKIQFEEYRLVKDILDRKHNIEETLSRASDEIKALFSDRWHQFIKTRDDFITYVENYYKAMMERVARISYSALFEKHLNIIIFPEGTRSTVLAEGKSGLAQLALHTGKKIVPVGCNNCESIYPGSLPFAKSGTVTYRVGKPLSLDEDLKDFRITEKFKLFSRESQERFKDNFEGVTRVVMERIYHLLDDRYKTKEPREEKG